MGESVKVWVDPTFKRALKKMAAEKDTTIIQLSKELLETNIFEDKPKKEDEFKLRLRI